MKIAQAKVKLVIFAQGRTGSTLLEWLLCSTGYFEKNGELLNPEVHENIEKPDQHIIALSDDSDNFVFHVKLEHLLKQGVAPIDPANFLEKLVACGWQVIYLRRKNKLKHVASNLVANKRGSYVKYKQGKELFRLKVDCDDFITRVNDRMMQDRAERAALININYFEVTYEDDLENSKSHQSTIDRLLDWTSLSSKKVSAPIKKINTQTLEEIVINYDEFISAIREQGWQRYLD